MKEKSIKGITLVALVITIVILLILAGISIQAITNTGLFEKSNRRK
jgi:Tfp pilus assembly protein PilE